MDIELLRHTAETLVASGKSIPAVDKSPPTIKKRLDSIGVESTETSRRDFRELLFRASRVQASALLFHRRPTSLWFISGPLLF